MDRIKTFEGFALPYEEGADALSLRFFNILKDNPKAVEEFKKELRDEKRDGSIFNVDWFSYGLKEKELKKLPGGIPSLGQVTAASKKAYQLYKKWLKENPVMKSKTLNPLSKVSGVFENVTNDDLIRNCVQAFGNGARMKWRKIAKGDVHTVINIDNEDGLEDIDHTPTVFKLKAVGDKIEVDPYQIVAEGIFMIPKTVAVEFFQKLGEIIFNHVPNKYSKRGPKHSWEKAKDEVENLITIYTSEKLPSVAKYGVFDVPE